MTTGNGGSLWTQFQHDPRDPAYAAMRASDRDRAVVLDALGEAYADGRLDRDELDERTSQVNAAKTYAELVPPLRDLVTDVAPSRTSLVSPVDNERAARSYYSAHLRETFFEFLVPNLICWAIWYMTGHDYWPWPVFVTIPTGLNLLRVMVSRGEIVEKRIAKLEHRQAKELEPPKGPKPSKAAKPSTTASTEDGPILREHRDEPEQA